MGSGQSPTYQTPEKMTQGSDSDSGPEDHAAHKQENEAHSKKPVTIYDWRDDSGISDTLNNESDRSMICERGRCLGSKMNTTAANKPLALDKALAQAKDFLRQYYADTTHHAKPEKGLQERQVEVLAELREKKTYDLTSDELEWGARMAWRNAPRCPARIVWKKLHVFDKRHIDNTDEMFKATMEHLDFSNNGGNIRPAITLFRQRLPGKTDPRVWNGLITGFAAYEQEDGSIIGDPSTLGVTKFCQKLGWKGKGGMFDFLPMLFSGADGVPHYYDIPEKYLLRIKIQHPTIEGINSLNLQWFGLPGVSSMMLECGGIQFPAAPFAGWYQGSEVASRDLLDPQRYNLLEPLGMAMGLDMASNTTLWKDEVALELNRAVLISYKKAGVSMVDHFTQADQFIEHLASETKERGGCPADWVWIVPPQSGSLTSTFHQEMVNYHLSPSYEYQDKPYETYGRAANRKSFRSVAWSVCMWTGLFSKMAKKRKQVTIFYSSETGTAKKYAKQAAEMFKMSYNTSIFSLDDENVNISNLAASHLGLVIVSTFGNGEPPEMSRPYNNGLTGVVSRYEDGNEYTLATMEFAKKIHFSVFGLGSTAYPKFAAFGEHLDTCYDILGFQRILPFEAGDELKDQRGSFNKWLKKVFTYSLKVMQVDAPSSYLENLSSKKRYKWTISNKKPMKSLNESLSEFHGKDVQDFTLAKRSHLHNESKEPKTVKVDFQYDNSEISYDPGDHLSIFPRNNAKKVEYLKSRMNNNPPSNKLVTLQVESDGFWENAEDLPTEVLFDDLFHYFLDINMVPSQEMMGVFATFAADKQEKETLTFLAHDDVSYLKWIEGEKCVCETLHEFESVSINSAILVGHFTVIKPRRYSIASSPQGKNVSLVLSVVEYKTKIGTNKVGLASGNLNNMEPKTTIPGFIKYVNKVHFRLPEDPSWPIIMIAAGSGIAPFRGFWMRRWEQQQDGYAVGKTLLYFGCRKKSMNLFKNETEAASKNNQSLSSLRWMMQCSNDNLLDFEREVAYSREPGQPKQYVQNLITRDAEKIYDLWQKKGGYIYICGKIKMAEEVGQALTEVLTHLGNMDKATANATLEDMRKLYRYQEDIFG